MLNEPIVLASILIETALIKVFNAFNSAAKISKAMDIVIKSPQNEKMHI